MTYLVLARKWRPQAFNQLVGQAHINKPLQNALAQQRLHHAYLFTGTRGVGKTSIARILAKALNCEQGIQAEPCLECNACLAIEEGRFIDLIEIDGASKTRVEDIRDLLDNVPYLPTAGRFKIYLIDEVHMLSQHSFNALLKTLEEPPAHVKFLLATTEPQKIPTTILSRCLQFTLKPVSTELIDSHLQSILIKENIRFEAEATYLLANAAKGSLRDGLSLLDQAISSTHDVLDVANTKTILGYTHQNYAIPLIKALLNNDAQTLLATSRQIALEGGSFRYVLEEMLHSLHQVIIKQNLPEKNELIRIEPIVEEMAQLSLPEDIHLFYQIALNGLGELEKAPAAYVGFEMVLLRMLTFKPAPQVNIPPLIHEQLPQSSPPEMQSPQVIPKKEANSHHVTSENTPLAMENKPAILDDWASILKQLKLTGLALNAAENAELVNKSGREITLAITKGYQSLFTPVITTRLENALATFFNESTIRIILTEQSSTRSSPAQQKQIRVNQQLQEAEHTLKNDSVFQELQKTFSVDLDKTSIVIQKDDYN